MSDIVCDKCVYQQADGECHKLIGQRANRSKCPDICREAWPGERVCQWVSETPFILPPSFYLPPLSGDEEEGE